MFSIRPARPDDTYSLYRICLQTADNGDDASEIYADPLILGHFYVGPYIAFEPNLCFVLSDQQSPDPLAGGGVAGYVLGTSNSSAFRHYCEQNWFPPVRSRYPLPPVDDRSADASMVRSIHRGHELHQSDNFPAHLHIDIMPRARGQGFGKRLIKSFCGQLEVMGVTGVHLRVGPANTNAIGFYQHLGFEQVDAQSGYVEMALALDHGQPTHD